MRRQSRELGCGWRCACGTAELAWVWLVGGTAVAVVADVDDLIIVS